MSRFLGSAVLIGVLLTCTAPAQDNSLPRGGGLVLGVGENGVCFGNSPRHNGLRFNWSDAGIEEINGFNLTLWKPAEQLSGTVNGLSLGVVAPGASPSDPATLRRLLPHSEEVSLTRKKLAII